MAVNNTGLSREFLVSKDASALNPVFVISESREVLYADAARFDAAGASLEWLTSRETPPEVMTFVSLMHKEFLYSDIVKAYHFNQSAEWLTSQDEARDYHNVALVYKEVLYRMNGFAMTSVSRETLMVLDAVPTIFAQYTQTLQAVTQALPVPPMAQIISVERAGQAYSLVIQASDPLPFVYSTSSVAQSRVQVVQAVPPVRPVSTERAAQMRSLAVTRSAMPLPPDVVSPERLGQNVMLVCQSLDIPYQPTSGLYAPQHYTQVVQQLPGQQMWHSPAFIAQYSVRVMQKRTPEPFPRSLTTVGEQRSQVVQATVMPVPMGLQMAAQTTLLAVAGTNMPEPIGMQTAKQATLLTLQGAVTPMPQSRTRVPQETVRVVQSFVQPLPISRVRVPQETVRVVQSFVQPLPISRIRVPQMVSLAVAGTPYDAPGGMLARTRAAQARALVMQASGFGPAERQSVTTLAQARLTFTTRADPNWYPPPGTVYERSRNVFAPQFVEQVVMDNREPLPLSKMSVPQYNIITVSYTKEPSPAQMADSGVFSSQIYAQIGVEAQYFSTDIPASLLDISQVIQQYAVEATYPDAFLPTNYAVTFQIHEQIASEVIYDAPESLHSPVKAAHVIEQLALTTGFPDPETLHAPLAVSLVTEQLSVSALYPSKDVPQSAVRVPKLAQQTAVIARYPDKSTPQATERVSQVRQTIVTRDTSMYQLPELPRRHRVRITVQLVY